MIRPLLLILLVSLFTCKDALADETITAQEIENYFYANGEMKRSKGQFEVTYYIEGDTITRTLVYDLNKKQARPDDTVYSIVRDLWSDPSKGLSFGRGPVIRAIGKPGADAPEILAIGETYIQSVTSALDYFVISRYKRIK